MANENNPADEAVIREWSNFKNKAKAEDEAAQKMLKAYLKAAIRENPSNRSNVAREVLGAMKGQQPLSKPKGGPMTEMELLEAEQDRPWER